MRICSSKKWTPTVYGLVPSAVGWRRLFWHAMVAWLDLGAAVCAAEITFNVREAEISKVTEMVAEVTAMSANNRWIHGESCHFAADFISFSGRWGILNSFVMRLGYFLHLFSFSCSSRRTCCMSMAANRSARLLLPLSKMANVVRIGQILY